MNEYLKIAMNFICKKAILFKKIIDIFRSEYSF